MALRSGGSETHGQPRTLGALDAPKLGVAETIIGTTTTTKIGPTQVTMAMPVKEVLEQNIMTDAAVPGIN